MSQTNNEKQAILQSRRARAYRIVKDLALRSGHMRHERDGEGFDKFCDEFLIDCEFIDWFEAAGELSGGNK